MTKSFALEHQEEAKAHMSHDGVHWSRVMNLLKAQLILSAFDSAVNTVNESVFRHNSFYNLRYYNHRHKRRRAYK
jgi:hypothetical protein